MQYIQHHSIGGTIKPQNAKALTEAMFSLRSPTRRDIAERAQITEMTVCRAMTKLLDALFLQEDTKARTSTLSVADNLKFIIIDLTFEDYTLYLLSADSKIIRKHTYTFVPSLDLEDNLTIFLERARAEIECDCTKFSGLSVIFNTYDPAFRQKALSAASRAFGVPAPFALSVVDCLSAIRAASARNGQTAKSMYYLCLGHRNFAYYIDEHCAIAGSPQLLIDKGKPISDKMNACVSPEILGEIIFSLVNAAAATLDANLFLVESDRFVLGRTLADSIAKRLQFSFRDSRRLTICDTQPAQYIRGAALALQKQIMIDILTK